MKLVLELAFYTNGEWGFGDLSWLSNYQSQYFDNDFYEYTKIPEYDYTMEIRRVFSFNTYEDIIAIKGFLNRLIANIHGEDYMIGIVINFINRFINHLELNALTVKNYSYSDDFNGIDKEMYVSAYSTNKYVPKIKQIIYEDYSNAD